MSDARTDASEPPRPQGRGILDLIERIGNRLPEPALIFAMLAALVVVFSAIGVAAGWRVQPVKPQVERVEARDAAGDVVLDATGKPVLEPRLGEDGKPVVTLVASGDALEPRSLLTREGIYWMLSSMIRNFTTLPALGLVFVAMLGIGVAEKFGLFSAFMRCLALATPKRFITPMVVLIGANASVASDAGYIILPPLAAALYAAIGRSPVAGLAAAFAGVAGGFGGGFFPTAADGFLAGTATQAAHILDPSYHTVVATHNWYFKAVSSLVIMLAGWFVTDCIVEPRLRRQHADGAGLVEGESAMIEEMTVTPTERRGLIWAAVVMVLVLGPSRP